MKASVALLMLTAFFSVVHALDDVTPPTVVETFPVSGSDDVDPAVTEIRVTFDEPMMDGSWSWAYREKSRFPAIDGKPTYSDGRRTAVLPVKLEPGKTYEILVNSEAHRNFRDNAGNPAVPFVLTFRTRSAGN